MTYSTGGNPTNLHFHIPTLQTFAAYQGRSLLDEFDPKNVLDDVESLRQRSRLNQRLMDWCESFYNNLRRNNTTQNADIFWLITFLNHNDQKFIFISMPELKVCVSIINHVQVRNDRTAIIRLGHACLWITKCFLRSSRSMIQDYYDAMTRLATKMHTVLPSDVCARVLSYALLAFPPKAQRDFLMSLGADVAVTMTLGDPLLIAAGTGQLQYVKYHVIREDGTVNLKELKERRLITEDTLDPCCSLLQAAAKADDVELAELLFDIGVARSEDDLCVALSRGNLGVARFMITHGIKCEGPIYYKYARDISIARFLYEEAHCHIMDSLIYYCYSDAEVMKYLVDNGADANSNVINDDWRFGPNYSQSPLQVAATAETSRIPFLLEHSADPNHLEFLNQSRSPLKAYPYPLHQLVKRDDGPMVRLLLAYGAYKTINTSCALHEAAERHNIGMSRLLIRAGADVNAKDNGGCTPLMWFCSGTQDSVDDDVSMAYAQWVISHGASIRERDNEGQTALDYLPEWDVNLKVYLASLLDTASLHH